MAKRKKQTTIRCAQFPEAMGVILLTIVVTAFVVGTGVYFWQNTSNKIAENTLNNKISILENRLDNSDLMKKVEDDASPIQGATIEPAEGSEPVEAVKEPVYKDIRFDKCGQISLFIYEDWYLSFADGIKKQFVEPDDITSACYSNDGDMLIALVYTDYCTPPAIFKFNTQTKTLGITKIDGKGVNCISSPEVFGKRVDNVIKLVGTDGDAGCNWENHYDYHFQKNILELKRQYFVCEGKEGKWTNY